VFSECTLPEIAWDVEPIKEGGLNTYTHQLLGRRKSASLTLKNGVGTSLLVAWYIATMNESFTLPVAPLRRTITVILLNPLKIPVMTWNIDKAMPTKWSGPQLKTSENSVAIQSLEFSCGEITVIPGVGFG
jgi:phage tail-like protein